jgi:uncharacterized protein (DUF2384 family)
MAEPQHADGDRGGARADGRTEYLNRFVFTPEEAEVILGPNPANHAERYEEFRVLVCAVPLYWSNEQFTDWLHAKNTYLKGKKPIETFDDEDGFRRAAAAITGRRYRQRKRS